MKVGIIGFGKMGMLHGGLLNSIEGVELVAVADKSKIVLKAFKSLLSHISFFTSYEKMLNECQLDAVIISTPSFNHISIAKLAAKKGIHIFVEKPLSSDLEQANELKDYVKAKPLISMVGFCLRYMPTFAKGKEVILSDLLGKIQKVNSCIYISDVLTEQNGWRYDKKISGGGVLIDFAIHMVDLLYWYFGNVYSVSGETNSLYSKCVEDEVTVDFSFINGIKAHLESSWSKPEYRKSYAKIEISGEKGEMIITDQSIQVTLISGNAKTVYIDDYYPDLYQGYYMDIGGQNYSVQMEKFINAIKCGEQTDIDIESGAYIQNIIDKIYKSAELKSVLQLD